MKIFNEEEVNIAKKQYSDKFSKYDMLLLPAKSIMCNSETDFTAGVEYAESKIEDLCMGFAEYYYDNCDENPNYEFQFNKFLKERE